MASSILDQIDSNIRVVLGYPPGTITDRLARTVLAEIAVAVGAARQERRGDLHLVRLWDHFDGQRSIYGDDQGNILVRTDDLPDDPSWPVRVYRAEGSPPELVIARSVTRPPYSALVMVEPHWFVFPDMTICRAGFRRDPPIWVTWGQPGSGTLAQPAQEDHDG